MTPARLLLGVLLTLALAACSTSPPIAEAFVRDRTGQTARAYRSAVDTRDQAVTALTRALDMLADEALEGVHPATAYDLARRQMIRVQSRLDAADRAQALAETRSQDLLDNWKGELRLYDDKGLRADAEQRLDLARATRRTVNQSLRGVLDALRGASTELADRTLFLKHCRDQGELRPAPVSAEGMQRYAKARADLAEKAALADAAMRDWLAVLGQQPLPTP
ncbi:MAG: hypothetical protein HBSAPP03_08510 [Phycisphaerae bacterium]|nr:MAG: hypothetical protein HBSAPP03_08510 [Phycisphaerae bacterium]